MQIVIDISKEYYDEILKQGIDGSHLVPLYKAIQNGTLLPSHGGLKDIDRFLEKVKRDREHEIYLHSWTADDVIKYLSSDSYAPIIIESDKGE